MPLDLTINVDFFLIGLIDLWVKWFWVDQRAIDDFLLLLVFFVELKLVDDRLGGWWELNEGEIGSGVVVPVPLMGDLAVECLFGDEVCFDVFALFLDSCLVHVLLNKLLLNLFKAWCFQAHSE